MVRKNLKKTFAGLMAAAGLFLFFHSAYSLMGSESYRMMMTEIVGLANPTAKTGAGYSLLGTFSSMGSSISSGARYTVAWGVVNASRPPQLDMSTAHAYPNPCHRKRGCSGVNFTRLTLTGRIRIYTLSGELVRTIVKTGNLDSIGWDLKNESGRTVTSGLYIYHLEGEGSVKIGKLVIVR
ncbi:MAG: T9SS type A sorting domain-containing protein [Elusimicrobiales bacterium]|nr:T9SS type A sorting domain-containing protein [Elusimicrobiales bacterium]